MKFNASQKSHLIALVLTVLFHAAVVALLCAVYLTYSPSEDADRTWPPIDSAEILLGGEYVMIGDTPEPTPSQSASPAPAEPQPAPPAPQAESRVNSGEPAPQPAPVISSTRPSPAKAEVPEVKPEKTGPTKAEIEAAERAKREEETRNRIASKVQFGKPGTSTSGSGSGKTGSPNGNSNTGAVSGQAGFNLGGRSIASWATPPKGPLGSITVSVGVDRHGRVTQASYHSGTGAAAASAQARANCIAAAKRSTFSVALDAAEPIQHGTITYNFR